MSWVCRKTTVFDLFTLYFWYENLLSSDSHLKKEKILKDAIMWIEIDSGVFFRFFEKRGHLIGAQAHVLKLLLLISNKLKDLPLKKESIKYMYREWFAKHTIRFAR